MPVAAALASGLPLMVGVWFGHFAYGLTASVGGLIFLYMPPTPMHHRMVTLMTCAFGMNACFALGLICHFHASAMVPTLACIAMLVTMVCRFYGVGMPGSMFFVMAAAIAAYSPVEMAQLPFMVGLMSLGTVQACLIGFLYSLWTLRERPAIEVPALPRPSFDFVVLDAVVIGACVGISLLLAHAFSLQKAYWVPVSCLSVIQGASLRAVWTKPFHRVIGTGLGLILAWGMLSVQASPWMVALAMMALSFLIETLVVRNYTLAAIFITPMTILLAEAASLGQMSPTTLIAARFFDTLLGCAVGLAGGICLHNPSFRAALGRQLMRLSPRRFLR